MTALLQLDVLPYEADDLPHKPEVGIIHAAWQDHPEWKPEDVWVAFRARSLSHPDRPPYPGIVVATQDLAGPSGPRRVRVEVWTEDDDLPVLRCVHQTVLAVGSVGVDVGNRHGGGKERLMLARGDYPLRVLVDADRPEDVSRVVFSIGHRHERGTVRSLPTR
jgi:hypothetical protein